MGYITFEQYSNENSRFYQVERVDTGTGSEEILKTEERMFARLDSGKMGRSGNPSRTGEVRVPDDPVNAPKPSNHRSSER
jgi:hypothetical protein